MPTSETSCQKRDREFLERVMEERDRTYTDRIRALEKLVDERDRLYLEKFKGAEVAVAAALAAQEKSVNSAFAASEKAIVKAEQAQKEYNERSNEFRGQLDDQAKTLMPRPETLSMFRGVEDKISSSVAALDAKIHGVDVQIDSLRLSRSEGSGKASARYDVHSDRLWGIGIVVAIGLAVIGLFKFYVAVPSVQSTQPNVVYVPVPAGQTAPTPALVPAPLPGK